MKTLHISVCLLLAVAGQVAASTNTSCVKRDLQPAGNETLNHLAPILQKWEAALLVVLGFGGFSVLLALLYNAIRRHVFRDVSSLDTTFDAGGRVSMSLTAVTVMSQLLWPGDLLQSATVATRNGVAGTFWYSVGAVVNMILFPVLSVHFKTRAPGAKTYLQIVYARFGAPAHIVFCFFALLTNAIVISCLLVAANATITALVADASPEFSVILMATLFGSYSFIGGLGTTFYVSYFNTALTFVCLITFIVKIFYVNDNSEGIMGNMTAIYEQLSCLKAPETNADESYLTFWSGGALIWGVLGIFSTSSLTFCDQASWQSRIAAKPIEGVLGFLFASFMWFAIPTSIGTTSGLAYLALSASNYSYTIPTPSIDAGLVTPYIAEIALGKTGGLMVLTMLTMALMSSGSGEVMAISSVIVYDIYQTYIRPFRSHMSPDDCPLCGLKRRADGKGGDPDNSEECSCPKVYQCGDCQKDIRKYQDESVPRKELVYTCETHGKYRRYLDSLVDFKNWAILWVTIAIVPWGLVVVSTQLDLNWIMMDGFIVTIPGFPGALLSIIWSRTTAKAVIAGALSGLVGGASMVLIVASTYDGGLDNFLVNTSQYYSVLAGCSTSFGLSLIVTVVVSLITNQIRTPEDETREWQKLREIDNPLRTWGELYKEDFPDLSDGERPSYAQLEAMFRKAKVTAYIGGALSLCLFIVLIPAVMTSLHVLSEAQFSTWMMTLQCWLFVMAGIAMVAAPCEEILAIVRQCRMGSPRSPSSDKLANGANAFELVGEVNRDGAPPVSV
nr:DUR3-like urea transporter subtype A2 [Theodoxus fluviatilis]